jgi:hypothetical protein
MSLTKTCIKCTIVRDSREYKFIQYQAQTLHMVCYLCVKDITYIKCLICDNDYSTEINSKINPTGPHLPNVCDTCTSTMRASAIPAYINRIFTILGKQSNHNSEKYENSIKLLETNSVKNLETCKKYAIDETNKKIKDIETKYEKLMTEKMDQLEQKIEQKYEKLMKEKIKEFEQKYEQLIDGDDYDIIYVFENKITKLEESNNAMESDKIEQEKKIIIYKKQMDEFEVLDMNYTNLKNKLSELIILKPTTAVCDMVYLYKCISDTQEQVDDIDEKRKIYIKTYKQNTSTQEYLTDITECINSNTKKIERMQHFIN